MRYLLLLSIICQSAFAVENCMNKWDIATAQSYVAGSVGVDVSSAVCTSLGGHPCLCADNLGSNLKMPFAKLVSANDGSGDYVLAVDPAKKAAIDAAASVVAAQMATIKSKIQSGTANLSDVIIYIQLRGL